MNPGELKIIQTTIRWVDTNHSKLIPKNCPAGSRSACIAQNYQTNLTCKFYSGPDNDPKNIRCSYKENSVRFIEDEKP